LPSKPASKRRLHLPAIEPSVRFVQALETPGSVRLLLDENPDVPSLLQLLPAERSTSDRIALLFRGTEQ